MNGRVRKLICDPFEVFMELVGLSFEKFIDHHAQRTTFEYSAETMSLSAEADVVSRKTRYFGVRTVVRKGGRILE